jgi:hypothetical protein
LAGDYMNLFEKFIDGLAESVHKTGFVISNKITELQASQSGDPHFKTYSYEEAQQRNKETFSKIAYDKYWSNYDKKIKEVYRIKSTDIPSKNEENNSGIIMLLGGLVALILLFRG